MPVHYYVRCNTRLSRTRRSTRHLSLSSTSTSTAHETAHPEGAGHGPKLPQATQAALARTRDTARRACDYTGSLRSSDCAECSSVVLPCKCFHTITHLLPLYLVVSRCISIFVVSRCLVFLSSLYVAMFLVLLGLTLSVSFLEVTLAIDELRGLRLLLLTLSFLEVLALAKDELRLLLIPLPSRV